MNRAPLWFAAIALALCGIVSPSQAKVNFSGTWKLNIGKREFGGLPGPESRTDKIDHQDPDFRISITTAGAQGERTFPVSLTTDGKETSNTVGNTEVKGAAKWDGDALVFTYTFKSEGRETKMTDTVTLSSDSKTLTRSVNWMRDEGEVHQKLAFEKP